VLVNSPSACDYLIAPEASTIGYRIITVTNGTLTIEPGAVIRFAEGGGLRIENNASLQAIGTPQARIRFEGLAAIKGYGLGVFLEAESLESTIAYTDFAYLGREDISFFKYWNGALAGLQGNGLHLTNTTIMGSNYYGANLNQLVLLEFANNTFYDNAKEGLVVTAPQVSLLDATSDYLGESKANGEPYIRIENLEPIVTDTVWQTLNTPYFIPFGLNIEGATFTPEPGVRFVFGEGSGLDVGGGGTLLALGTADKPIVFTGQEETAGFWGSLVFSSASPDSRLEYTEVRYGGGGVIYEGNIFVAFQDSLYVANSIITDSLTWGICADPAATLDLGSGNTFERNALEDVNTNCD
jgi:hypothetical protein